MEYFGAVVKETLSIGMVFTRSGGAEVLPGVWVPGGYEVGISNWVVGRDRTLYSGGALEFRPERWLVDGDRARKRTPAGGIQRTVGWTERNDIGG